MSKKNKGPKPGESPKGGLPKFNFSWLYIAVFVGLLGLQFAQSQFGSQTKPSTFNELSARIERGHVDRVKVVNSKEVYVFINADSLAARVLTQEHQMYPKVVARLLASIKG